MSTKNISRYLVTSAEKGAPLHGAFLTSLEQYAEAVDAQILVIPLDGKHPDEDEIHPRISANPNIVIVEDDMPLNKRLSIIQFYIKPSQRNPLTGLGHLVQLKNSAIVGATKQHMLPKANSNKDLPKILMSTGVITRPNYKETRVGKLATEEHTYGALYVEVNEENFQFRQIQAMADGSFTDFAIEFKGNGKPVAVRPEALVLGDIHTGSTCPVVLQKALELIHRLSPKYLVLHDLFDGQSVNHHEEEHYINRSQTFARNDLFTELNACGQMVELLLSAGPADMQIVVVKSNHDEFLTRYLQAGKFATDPRNLWISSLLAALVSKPSPLPAGPGIKTPFGTIAVTLTQPAKTDAPDILEEGIALAFKKFKRVKFLKRTDDFKLRGWQLGCHGDRGANGKKSSGFAELMEHTGKSITGHKHSPGIFRDAFVVGTSTVLNLDYAAGAPSSWMNTHAVLYPNGKAQLINIIEGDFKL